MPKNDIVLILSAIIFIVAFGIHAAIKGQDVLDHPMYVDIPILNLLPLVFGFVLPVYVWSRITELHWAICFVLNLLAIWIIGPWLTRTYLTRFSSGKGLGVDMVYAFSLGIITFVVGLIL